MDVPIDPSIRRRKQRRRASYAGAILVALAIMSAALARIGPSPVTVNRGAVVLDTVTRGSFVRQVRGLGTLVPEDTRWLPAMTDGRVDRILVRPGAAVQPDSVILELSNPQVEQEVLNARLALEAAEAALENFRVQLRSDLLTQEAQVVTVAAEYKQARMEADTNEALAKQQLVSNLLLRQSQLRAETLQARVEIEKKRLQMASDALETRLRVQMATASQARTVADLQQRRRADLKVRPGFAGVLQQVPVDVGQQVATGQNLARVADPAKLKAQLRIAEREARDVDIGQRALIDTHIGIVPGRVSRKDPAATNGTVSVDVTLTGQLPRGAVPDLSVDGTIELDRVEGALQVGRPVFAQEHSTIWLFRVDTAGYATRVKVQTGRSSVHAIEVLSGLEEGDRVVVSDMSAWNDVPRVRLR